MHARGADATPAVDAPTLAGTVRTVMLRELRAARRMVEAYPDDAGPWTERPGLPNVGGTLVLHIAGNLQYFFGTVLGGTSYRRDRDAEFARRGVPRAELLAELDAAIAVVDRVLATLTPAVLDADYPVPILGRVVHTRDYLVHLAMHLAYHLGQLDYHRRVVTGSSAGVAALAPAELPGRDAG